MVDHNKFDQFYTNPLTAKKLTSIFTEKLKELGYQKITFIEPSAGTGNFLEAIRKISKNNPFISRKILAFDIEPKSDKENIIQTNFLTLNWKKYLVKSNNYVVLGNPPFGKRDITFFHGADVIYLQLSRQLIGFFEKEREIKQFEKEFIRNLPKSERGWKVYIRIVYDQVKSLLSPQGELNYFEHPRRKECEDKVLKWLEGKN